MSNQKAEVQQLASIDLFDEKFDRCSRRKVVKPRTVTNQAPSTPTLMQLCTSKVRSMRARLEGLTILPEHVIKKIIDGSSAEELKQIEAKNPDAVNLKFWDEFWRAACEKRMVRGGGVKSPRQLKGKHFSHFVFSPCGQHFLSLLQTSVFFNF